MLLKFTSIQNKHIKRVLEHIVYLAILLVLIPSFLYFELSVVLPTVAEVGTLPYFAHLVCATFLSFNIVGNLIYGVFTNTSIKGRLLDAECKKSWTFCSVCECMRPPRAWHCETCDICILKRDHHCTFFACCVGYYNFRYFLLFTFYVFVAMVYAFYFNIKFISEFVTWNHGLVIIKFIFPLASFVVDFGDETLYIFLIVINVIIAAFTGFLFFYHFKNVLKGKTVPETKLFTKDFMYDKGWKSNVIEVLGTRWYLAWILPFIRSPLPGNGIDWVVQDKYK